MLTIKKYFLTISALVKSTLNRFNIHIYALFIFKLFTAIFTFPYIFFFSIYVIFPVFMFYLINYHEKLYLLTFNLSDKGSISQLSSLSYAWNWNFKGVHFTVFTDLYWTGIVSYPSFCEAGLWQFIGKVRYFL